MDIIVNTITGTYIVPLDKQSQFIQWLEINAVKPARDNYNPPHIALGHMPPGIGEIKEGQFTGRQLINE